MLTSLRPMPGAECQMPMRLFGMRISQRLEQNSFDDAEDDGVCSDANGQSDQRNGCEEWRAGEPPESMGKVVFQGRHRVASCQG